MYPQAAYGDRTRGDIDRTNLELRRRKGRHLVDATPVTMSQPTIRILVIHGPNLNLLGTREPDVYGTVTIEQVNAMIRDWASSHNVEVLIFQSNHEGAILDQIHSALGSLPITATPYVMRSSPWVYPRWRFTSPTSTLGSRSATLQ